MFEPCFNTSGGISSPQNNVQQIPPILFRKRTEKIDWRRLASIDVNRIASHVDIESLQEMLTSVTFCDITSEIDTRYIDTNFIKLFQLAQLLIEYLLYSQDYLTTSLDSLKEQNQELNKKCEKLKQQLQEKTNRLTLTRRECHRRRLLLMAQQELMDSGPQSLHKCMYCPKAFVNASFLATHIHRRHPETEMPHVNVPYSTAHMTGTVTDDMPYPHTQHLPCCGAMHPSKMSPRQMPQQTECHYTTNNNMSASLERDVRALLEQLKSVTPSLPNRSNSPVKSIGFDVDIATKGTNESDWHTQLLEEHRRDIEAMKRGFEKELHALQIQYNQTQEELYKLKCRPATSNLGELENDVSGPVFRPSRAASASGSIRRSGYNRNYDEQVEIGSHHSLQIDDKESTVHGSTVSGSTTRFVRRRSPQQAFRDTINNEGKEESEAQQVSRAMGRVLTASGGTSPTPSLNASTNMLRYSRLLDQLRSDPETLRKLRHEVEQLLIEQLNERGIKQDQNRLSTSQLNQKLNVLNKEREHLAKKHPNFMEIRDALAQHVDRLAHATIRGSTGNIIELRQRGENNQKMNFSYKAGLPPPAAYSPASLRRAGTLPLASQRVDVTSNLGVSLPILSVNNDMGSSQSNMTEGMNSLNKRPTGYFESKPRLQRSSPQLQYITEETKSESSASKQQPPSIHQQAHTTSQKYSPSHMNNNNNNNTSNNNNNNNSSINNSSSNGQQKHGTSNSPEIHFSHDQKVVTFGGQSSETNRNLAVVQSSEDDEWDSETEDLNAVAAEINKAQQLNLSNSTQKLVNPRNLEVSFYKPSNSNTTTNNNIKQGNNNASIPPNPQGIKYSLYKGQSLKTDDEDIFSVSSINGGLAEDNSLSLAPEVSPRHTKRPVGVSRSLDPSVAAAHAEASALGPRPTTRVGGINRQPITAKHTSIGSPELSNTMATSLWGTNSKAASPSTNVISVARSDGAYDEFDSDD
uniref:C2H2-type domain-containing protein n=1 Tax=Trichobilharzia regenti TaxID=157069 RepID=A0AA85JIE1_TRIRE|nr:unnamed protein product [Trichobilharzia regenti]